jgi:hypothetical protein
MYSNFKPFYYRPTTIRNSYTESDVQGFKFPAGAAYDATNAADLENLQQFQLYFGVNDVLNSLEDLLRVGTEKTKRLFLPYAYELKREYDRQCIAALTLASSMCWIWDGKGADAATGAPPNNPRYINKLSPDQALYEVRPAVEGLLLAVQTKMDLTFPKELIKGVARLEIDKDLLSMKENVPVTRRGR